MYLVYGLQKSGISIVRLFKKKNTHYKVWDDNKNTRNKLKKDFPNKNSSLLSEDNILED